ncbi:MAG: ATPase AAA-2 domain-containing protein, ATP-dependent Clp protease ATP-binding subunit ClpC [Candidatus Peregrinibacteria bacterium GW2011_GWC2_39_14]|nr:MAG: ATPase AAA-2 domain protein [Candidatus Peregrinibacteria bacterium GW2011_GWA2_38_36]KKR05164.1 MAG: ATPase AAA-2 domain-containing protein, ATP-dependent Clp protease ATP-binding subunit ClpC [Candidatus Peregrinibacteria bacterium GW2011_GWC2_39_14]
MTDFNKFEKFTKEAKQALVVAQEKAKEAKLTYIGTEHVLIGILSQQNSLGSSILMNFGVTLENVNLVLQSVERSGMQKTSDRGPAGLSGFAKRVIEDAAKCAEGYGHQFVGTEHLLFALVSQENTAATVILENMKINPKNIREQVTEIFERSKENMKEMSTNANNMGGMNPIEFLLNGLQGVLVNNMNTNKDQYKDAYKHKKQASGGQKASKTPALDYFTTDLVEEARSKKLDPVIGRSKEIQRVISIICRKTKNNPVLIGEPGVGKTAVVEGLAQAIASEQVPDNMLNKRILSLSMTSLIAGTKYRGEFEERIKQVLDEAAGQTNILIFIDELHTVIGAGSAEGSLDAANILKPAMSRGKVQIIGATTTNEYRKHVEHDPALERRFQTVMVEEPSEEDSYQMLLGLRKGLEDHHNLIITDEALHAAVTLSKRYIMDKFLPDKGIDLVDEAASLKRMSFKGNHDGIKKSQDEWNAIIKQKEEAVSSQNYELAAELRNKEVAIMKQMEEAKNVKIPREKRDKVTEEDIANVVSVMTGIPVTRLIKTEVARLMSLEDVLRKRIIAQTEAVEAISKAIRRARAGFSDFNRPIGSFMFLGPTGVGKTELVKVLAEEVFNDKNALVKIDMSEFMEKHNTSRLTGTTAGYVGYDEGGQLTETVRRKPYSVILFDEIEKAHPDTFNLLLQILEDGSLTDGKGRKVDFKNTIIIMTSNIGAEKLTEKAAPLGFSVRGHELEQAYSDYDAIKEEITRDLKRKFRPEFLNRLDKIIFFKPLQHEDIKKIVTLHLGYLEERLSKKSLKFELTPASLEVLAKLSYDPQYGARPVRRTLRDVVEDPLTQGFLEGKFKEGDVIKIVKKGESQVELERADSGDAVAKTAELSTVSATASTAPSAPAKPARKIARKSTKKE